MLVIAVVSLCLNSIFLRLAIKHAFADGGAEVICLVVKDGFVSSFLGINLHPADGIFYHNEVLS